MIRNNLTTRSPKIVGHRCVFFYICMRVHGHHGYFTDLFKGVVSAGKRDALKQHEFDWHVFLLLYSLLVKFSMLLHNAAHHSQV